MADRGTAREVDGEEVAMMDEGEKKSGERGTK